MSFGRKLSIIIFVTSLMTGNAFSRTATEQEVNLLQQTIEDKAPGMKKDDIDTVLSLMPPSIFKILAEKYDNYSPEQIRAATRQTLVQLYSQAKTEEWEADIGNKKACELTNGEPCFIVPVIQTIQIGDKKIKINVSMVAIIEDQKWYLINTAEEKQQAVFKELFPGIENVNISAPQIEELK